MFCLQIYFFLQMQNVRNEDFGSCGKSLLRKKCTDEADETMGDFLCGQVFHQHGIDCNGRKQNFGKIEIILI